MAKTAAERAQRYRAKRRAETDQVQRRWHDVQLLLAAALAKAPHALLRDDGLRLRELELREDLGLLCDRAVAVQIVNGLTAGIAPADLPVWVIDRGAGLNPSPLDPFALHPFDFVFRSRHPSSFRYDSGSLRNLWQPRPEVSVSPTQLEELAVFTLLLVCTLTCNNLTSLTALSSSPRLVVARELLALINERNLTPWDAAQRWFTEQVLPLARGGRGVAATPTDAVAGDARSAVGHG